MPKNYEPKEEKRGCKESKQDIEHFQDRSHGSLLLTETFSGIAGSRRPVNPRLMGWRLNCAFLALTRTGPGDQFSEQLLPPAVKFCVILKSEWHI